MCEQTGQQIFGLCVVIIVGNVGPKVSSLSAVRGRDRNRVVLTATRIDVNRLSLVIAVLFGDRNKKQEKALLCLAGGNSLVETFFVLAWSKVEHVTCDGCVCGGRVVICYREVVSNCPTQQLLKICRARELTSAEC